MIKIENVVGPSPEQMMFIIQGMRNPLNSWDKFDSIITESSVSEGRKDTLQLGAADEDLMLRLVKGGPEHRKFMRMMPIYARITAPLYFWKECDTYKIGTVSNSCSTMHKIAAKEFTLEDFSCEHIGDVQNCDPMYYAALEGTIMALNEARHCFLDTKEKCYWWQMIQLLPSSYNQTRNISMNYEVLYNIYHQRQGHKLDEWNEFCKWIETVPYHTVIARAKGPLFKFLTEGQAAPTKEEKIAPFIKLAGKTK